MSAHASDRPDVVHVGPSGRQLARAAEAAVRAPSVLNTQPWQWRITHDTARVRADRRRQLRILDPSGRLLTVSCGAALHHACVALAAEGVDFGIDVLPDGDDPDLLAVVHHRGRAQPSASAQRLRRAIAVRRSDRRPFAGRPVPQDTIDRLRRAAERTNADLRIVRSCEMASMALAAAQAAEAMFGDPEYRAELGVWIRQPGEGSDGVPVDTLAPLGVRPVPVRDFAASGFGTGAVNRIDISDREARYGIIVTDGDGPGDWLTAGVTLSAVLLTATAEHLATSPMSDLVENEVARNTLRRMIGGAGYPAVGVRIGVPAAGPALSRAPRRPAAEVIEVVADP